MRAHRHLALLAEGVFFSKEALAQIGSHTTSAGLASHSWSLSIIADGYVVPHAVFFVSPIIASPILKRNASTSADMCTSTSLTRLVSRLSANSMSIFGGDIINLLYMIEC